MYLLLITLPFIGSCSAGLFGIRLGLQGSSIITTGCLSLSFLLAFFAFYVIVLMSCCTYIKLINWIDSEGLNVDWGFMFDNLTVSMCCVVIFVLSLVHLYSIEYMSYLSLFTFFMLILVTADNFVQMFVGWEGVSLCSYLLINFWFTRIQANKAAIKAVDYSNAGRLKSYLTCDAPEDWQSNIAETSHNYLSLDLLLMLMLIFGLTCTVVLYLIKPFFYPYKKRKTITAIIVDSYIYLFIGVMSRSVPRRFTMSTLSLGSFINRSLYIKGFITLKLAIILAFVLPMVCFMTFLCLSMLPFYLAGGFPTTFGQDLFRFLNRNASEEVFALLIKKKKKIRIKKIPLIQKRSFRATVRVSGVGSDVISDLTLFIAKLGAAPVDVTHARHMRMVQDVIKTSYNTGCWSQMRRPFPVSQAKILLTQAHNCSLKAEMLANEAFVGTGAFLPFRYPTSYIQLVVENGASDLLRATSQYVRVGSALQNELSQGVGEAATNTDIWLSMGVVGVSGVGLLFCTTYQESPEFRKRTQAYILAGRTLDNEGEVVAPYIMDTIYSHPAYNACKNARIENMDILTNDSNLSDLSDKSNGSEKYVGEFLNKLVDPNRVFLNPDDNKTLFEEVEHLFGKSDFSKFSKAVNPVEEQMMESSLEVSPETLGKRFKNIFRF
jgi:hypothetical protein